MSSRSSSSVSNSDASEAKSSSSSGRIFSRTSFTSTAKTASEPARLLGVVVGGEGDLDLALLSRLGPGELRLEALDQLVTPQLQQVVGCLAALERLAVDRALEVDQERVALGGGALDRLQPGEALADPLDLPLDDVVGDLDLRAPHLEALVLTELRRGRTPTSNLKESDSPSASGAETISMLGSPTGLSAESSSAFSYHSGNPSRIASWSTEPKPSRWITSEGGALPLRKPGIRISRASVREARCIARSTSAAGTSASTRARELGSSVTVVFTRA